MIGKHLAGRIRWWIAALLFLATVLNYLDRQVLSITAPVLREQLGMTATAYSRVVFAFMLAYTVMQAVSGRLVDRLGPRRGMMLAMISWSAACALHGLARSVFHLGVFRFMLGAAEAANWPASVKAVGQWFSPRERAFATGLFNSGSSVGATIAPPLVAWLTLAFSWRAAFVATGALGALWLIPWLLVYRSEPAPQLELALQPAFGWGRLIRLAPMWGLMLARFCADPVWWFYVFWLPDYLSRERQLSLARIGVLAAIPFLTAALGGFAGGWSSGCLITRGTPPVEARKQVMMVSALFMLAGLGAVAASSVTLSLSLVALATFAYNAWAVNLLTLPTDLFPAGAVASASGLSGAAAGVGGMLSSLSVGWLVDHASFTPVFAFAAAMPLIAAAFVCWLVRPLRPGCTEVASVLKL